MLKILKNDHVNIRRLITVLHNKAEALQNGKSIDFKLLRDVITYLKRDVERFHHFGEGQVYDYCLARNIDNKGVLVQLNEEHKLLESKTLELEAMVDGILQDSQTSLKSLGEFLADFITLQRQHMALEETQAHPLIQANLSNDDWANIKSQLKFDCNKDPLFGDKVAEHYQDLAEYLALV